MAVWFFLVLGSYLLIWVVTGDRDTLPTSVLALIGISAGTGLGAVIVDGGKRAAAGNDLLSLKAEEKASQDRSPQLTALAANASDDQKRSSPRKPRDSNWCRRKLRSSRRPLKRYRPEGSSSTSSAMPMASASSLPDGGVDRYARPVVCHLGLEGLTMPDFSNQLLGLLGISAGTYIGFKFPEKQT